MCVPLAYIRCFGWALVFDVCARMRKGGGGELGGETSMLFLW